MKSNLRIRTSGRKHEDEVIGVGVAADEAAASPTAQYFNSKFMSVCNIAILETDIPIVDDDLCVIQQLRDIFLPINPRLSSITISDENGVQRWKRVEVNLKDHVKIQEVPEVGLPIESYDYYFDEYLSKISIEALPQDRPLWEFHLVKYPTSKAAGHFIFKLHQALGDGYSLMGALLSCLQRADNPSLPLTFPSTKSTTSSKVVDEYTMGGIVKSLLTMLKGVSDFGSSLLKSTWNADSETPIRSGNAGLCLHQTQISTLRFSLDHIKFIKQKLGTTVNSVLVGIIFLGLRLYMQEFGAGFNKTKSTALILLNTRNIGGYKSVDEMKNDAHSKLWGNHIAFLHVAMPELIESCNYSKILDFVFEAQNQINRLKNSPALYLTAMWLKILTMCIGSQGAAKFIHGTIDNTSLAISNVIGPIEQVTMANYPIQGIYFTCCGAPLSLVVTIMSYMRSITIGLGVEKGFIDSKMLISCIDKAYELMYEAASNIN